MKQLIKIVPIFFTLVAPWSPLDAAEVEIVITDSPGFGFLNQSPVTPVQGNPGTTLGEQRFNVFQAAADYWGARLESDVPIQVDASFSALPCSQFGAVLGAAGPSAVSFNFANAPALETWYAGATANSLAGTDLSINSEINATFNSNIDLNNPNCLNGVGWDYRIGVNTGSPLELFSTVLHELGHGLGFASLANISTGVLFVGRDDAYTRCLYDTSVSLGWSEMNESQRIASSTNTGNVIWNCTEGGASNTLMYAPSPIEPGSSISHWDTSLSNPDELMEPIATPNTSSELTLGAMGDVGWRTTIAAESLEADLVLSCLAGLGRVDLNIVNNQSANSVYRYEFEGQAARQTSVAFEDWGRIPITGRPNGSYDVTVKRDGVAILSDSLDINCGEAIPNIHSKEVTVLNACRSGNGYILFQLVNPTNSTRGYVIEFEGVPNRSTSAAAFGQSVRATTGRPDGAYPYLVRTGSTVVDSGVIRVDCD